MNFICEGKGSYGIVLSPNLGIESNPYLHSDPNCVSKILYSDITLDDGTIIYNPVDTHTFEYETNSLNRLESCFSRIFTSNYFVLPINYGVLDINSLGSKIITISSLSSVPFEQHKATQCLTILNQMLDSNCPIYHIIFPKGSPIRLNVNDFYYKIKNVFDCLSECTESSIFLDDVTYNNLILHDSKIKIIDYANPLILNANDNFQTVRRALSNVKFKNTHYYLYNSILVQLAYSFSQNIDIVLDNYEIGIDENDLCPKGFYEIYKKTQKYDEDNIRYKNQLINRLFEIMWYYNPFYKICLKLKKFNVNRKYFECDEEIVELDLGLLSSAFRLTDDVVEKMFLYIDLYLKGTDLNYKLRWLFTHNNMHSFSVVLIQWMESNKNMFHFDSIEYLNKMADVIFKCMTCVVFKNNDIFINGCNWKDIVM